MSDRRPRLLVSIGAFISLLVVAVAVLAIAELGKFQKAETQKLASVTGLVIGLERQVLHFRGDLLAALERRSGLDDAVIRYEILVSRIELLRSSPGSDLFDSSSEHRTLAPQLEQIQSVGDRWAKAPTVNLSDAQQLLALIDQALPDVQSYTLGAASLSSSIMEEQLAKLRGQAMVIAGLAALQLGLVALGLRAWWLSQKRQDVARTRLEHLSEDLTQANASALEASHAKSRFLANMSHELRTPFQGVLGMLEILEKTPLSAQQGEMIHTAQESAHHLLLILNEVLDVSAIEAGRLSLRPEPLTPRLLCREVESLMRVHAEDKGLFLSLRIGPNLPEQVIGDITRIKQILFNLLNNAIKFTSSGTVSLEVGVTTTQAQVATFSFTVTDTGIGMDDDTRARLFRRFETGDSGVARGYGGAGLGLEISRNLARLMGGDLVAHSRQGQGSSFLLTLPLPLTEAPRERPPPVVEHAVTVHHLKVLVADDHPINRRYLALVLQSFGHSVTLCQNGAEAFELVQAGAFDVVLMDVHMPIMDGLTATRAIRALGGGRASMPILALTADVMGGARELALEAGVSAFLSKPVQIEQLRTALVAASAVNGTSAMPAQDRVKSFEAVSDVFRELQSSLPEAEVQELIEMFFADGSGELAQLKAHLYRGTSQQVCTAAHKFKGAARMLGFDYVAAAADRIETWAKGTGGREDCAVLDAELEGALAVTRAALSHEQGNGVGCRTQ